MDLKKLLRSLGLQGGRPTVYSTLPTTPTTPGLSDREDDKMTSRKQGVQLPTLSRFLADFTLGFADGLTVPFALTAGLSSLGQTETVIYAGMAEICAGSISMGIGGYLAARGDNAALARKDSGNDDDDSIDLEEVEKETTDVQSMDKDTLLEEYLAPLRLPPSLLKAVKSHAMEEHGVEGRVRLAMTKSGDGEEPETRVCSPILAGLSVAIGYLLGGLLPLFPYFFVGHVGDGLKWSFGVCVLALFVFGFSKDYLLQDADEEAWRTKSSASKWKKVKHSLWEGLQMVILGSIAAVAAVLCVRLFEGIVS